MATSDATTPKPSYAFIDCVRGYAVLLVITTHLTGAYPELPWPVRRFTALGWHGVQLFFLASAVTLMMSWRYEQARHGYADTRAFFVRRLLRIAPAYYLAALLYSLAWPPEQPSWLVLLTTLAFVNTWHPITTGTVPDSWAVVPGGWSVAVEFTFYALLPLLAAWITGIGRAFVFLAITLAIGLLANPFAQGLLQALYPAVAIDNFLYFWAPNQMPVFALGILLYFLVDDAMGADRLGLRRGIAGHGLALAGVGTLVCASVTFLNLPQSLTFRLPLPPPLLIAALGFMMFILALAAAPNRLLVNPLAQAMGKVSFSAYLVHFAVLRLLPDAHPALFHTAATNYAAIAAFTIAWVVVVVVVYAVSWCTYHAVELPMIRLARGLTARGTHPALA